jgi:hypothetical protein
MNGPKLVLSQLAFNRILDFSNGLDFYPGFFYWKASRRQEKILLICSRDVGCRTA